MAALTMPSLIANYQKKVLVTQLQKQVSVIGQNFQRIMVDEGAVKLSETSIWNNGMLDNQAYKDYFGLGEISSQSKTAKDLSAGSYGYNGSVNQTKDGAVIVYSGLTHSIHSNTLFIDVNGDKGPNKVGLDRYAMNVDEKNGYLSGNIYPEEGMLRETCKNGANAEPGVSTLLAWQIAGKACFELVRADGWQIKY